MSIYKPVSSASNALLGVGGSLLSGVSGALGNALGNMIPASSNPNLQALGNLGRSTINAGLGMASSEINRRTNSKVQNFAYDMDERFSSAKNSLLNTFGLGVFQDGRISQDALNMAGNLSFQDMYHLWRETNPDDLSRKNFYVIEINDRSDYAPTDKDGAKFSKFNLLTTNLQIVAFELQSETIEVGSIVLDKPMNSSRTEMQLTLLDDKYGTIKRWAERKSQSIAQSNGMFLPAIYYIFDVKVVFGTNVALSEYYNQIYTMRLASMHHDLGRGDQGLEEVALQFVQYDTCMPSFGA